MFTHYIYRDCDGQRHADSLWFLSGEKPETISGFIDYLTAQNRYLAAIPSDPSTVSNLQELLESVR